MPRKTFRKKITSDELIEEINPENKRLINKYLRHKNAKCSDTTITNYKSNLNMFFCYNVTYNDNKSFIDIKKIELAEFFDYCLMDLKWSGNRYEQMRSCLSSFSDFIVDFMDEEYPDFKNLINKAVAKVDKVPVRKKTIVTPEQVYDLRDYLIKEDKIEQATYLMLLASSGARISESLRIDTDMIDEKCTAFGDLFLETTKDLRTKGHGKKGYQISRFVIRDTFLPIYKKWLPIRDKIMKANNIQEHNAMFIKKNGTPIKVSTANSWLRQWEKYLNVNLYAHCFRHFIVSDLTRKGCSSDFIVAVMRWKSPNMYNIYNDLEAKDKKWKDVDKLKEALNSDLKKEDSKLDI